MPPGGVSGDGVLLFALTFDALTAGSSSLTLGFTPDDLTEGFTLAEGGFAEVIFANAEVTAVPAPATWLLLLAGIAAFGLVGRSFPKSAPRVGSSLLSL